MRFTPAVICFLLFFFTYSESHADLVAHWPLDETSGETVADLEGGKDGTLFNFDGTQWRDGVVGGALYFNGYSSYVSHGFTLPRDRGTLMHWVKPESYGRGMLYYESDIGNPLHGPTDYNGFNAGGEALEIHTAWKGDDGEFCFYFQDGPEAINECDSDHLIPDGWNHVAVTWDIEGEMILYLNCQRSGSEDFAGGTFQNFGTTQGYFGRPSDQERFFTGLLDDVRVYNHVITPEELEAFCEGGEYHSSVPAQEQSVLSNQLVEQFCAGLVQHGTHNIKDLTLLMQTPFGGGFVNAMETAFGPNGACYGVPWVAASASETLNLTRGWSDSEVDMNTVDSLGSTWTQAIAGPAGNIGGQQGAIFNGSITNNVVQDLLAAREIDIAGPNGKGTEDPQLAAGSGGNEMVWAGESAKHEALLFNAWGSDLRHGNDVQNMRYALERTWQGEVQNIGIYDLADPVTEDILEAFLMAVQRLDSDTQLLIYFTGLGDSTLDLSSHSCGLTGEAFQNGRSCCFNLPPGWYRGLFGNYRAGEQSGLAFEMDITSCVDCTNWEYKFNRRLAQFEADMIPGLGRLSFGPWELRPGRNCLDISTGISQFLELSGDSKIKIENSSIQLSGIRLTTGPLNTLHVSHSLKPGQSGAFFDPGRDGEGIFVELLDDDRAVVYMFTFNADGTGRQAWMLGVGEIIANAIVVTEMYRPTGPRFGPEFDPADKVLNPFGGMAFSMPTCATSESPGALFMSPPVDSEYETMWSENYVQLTGIVDCTQAQGHTDAAYSGSWFDPSHDGEGIILEVLPDGRALAQWFTYDYNGDQMWVQGVGDLNGNTLTVDRMYTAVGTTWGSMFDKNAVAKEDWGTLTMEFHSCDSATAVYESSIGFGNGTFNMIRLTSLLGIPCS